MGGQSSCEGGSRTSIRLAKQADGDAIRTRVEKLRRIYGLCASTTSASQAPCFGERIESAALSSQFGEEHVGSKAA